MTMRHEGIALLRVPPRAASEAPGTELVRSSVTPSGIAIGPGARAKDSIQHV